MPASEQPATSKLTVAVQLLTRDASGSLTRLEITYGLRVARGTHLSRDRGEYIRRSRWVLGAGVRIAGEPVAFGTERETVEQQLRFVRVKCVRRRANVEAGSASASRDCE